MVGFPAVVSDRGEALSVAYMYSLHAACRDIIIKPHSPSVSLLDRRLQLSDSSTYSHLQVLSGQESLADF